MVRFIPPGMNKQVAGRDRGLDQRALTEMTDSLKYRAMTVVFEERLDKLPSRRLALGRTPPWISPSEERQQRLHVLYELVHSRSEVVGVIHNRELLRVQVLAKLVARFELVQARPEIPLKYPQLPAYALERRAFSFKRIGKGKPCGGNCFKAFEEKRIERQLLPTMGLWLT